MIYIKVLNYLYRDQTQYNNVQSVLLSQSVNSVTNNYANVTRI